MKSSHQLKRFSVCGLAILCLATAVSAQAEPVQLNIVDVAGNLALTQKAFQSFQVQHPDLISRITFTNAPAPQLPGKIKAMQAAGRSDIDLQRC